MVFPIDLPQTKWRHRGFLIFPRVGRSFPVLTTHLLYTTSCGDFWKLRLQKLDHWISSWYYKWCHIKHNLDWFRSTSCSYHIISEIHQFSNAILPRKSPWMDGMSSAGTPTPGLCQRCSLGVWHNADAAGSSNSSATSSAGNHLDAADLPSGKHTKNYWKWPSIVDVHVKHADFL